MPKVRPKSRSRFALDDALLVTAGIALAVASAYFPWYIFTHQDQFGFPSVKLQGIESTAPSAGIRPTPLAAEPLSVSEVPVLGLDLFATGTVDEDVDRALVERAISQPFPSHIVPYRLIHVANGRAMIEDDTGIFVVQRGSTLPDASRVAAIERRGEEWVIVTDTDRVLRITD
jgi:hypothetical protein